MLSSYGTFWLTSRITFSLTICTHIIISNLIVGKFYIAFANFDFLWIIVKFYCSYFHYHSYHLYIRIR